jgi:hypothetical protein
MRFMIEYIMTKNLIFTEQEFLNQFNLPNPTFQEFCDTICVLDVMDRSGSFVVRSDLDTFVDRVSKKDNRKQRLNQYKQNLYKILVTDATNTLGAWFKRYGELKESVDFYFDIPDANILNGDTFAGRTNSKYGKICKNINFVNFYNTKKLYTNDSEYTFGLMKAMFEDFKVRNSLVGPAFFDHICKYDGDPSQFWLDFMIGANRASIFNPATYKGILDEVFTGETLFAPVMGWNAYQIAFYNSKFKNFIATDVIPDVVTNGSLLHDEWKKYADKGLFEVEEKNVDLYLCPSEELDKRHGFVAKYKESVDAVLLSPPYFDLEIYPSDDQSFTSFPDYQSWLKGYWEETVKLAVQVMKPGAKFGFVISNYVNRQKQMTTISEDMRDVVLKYLKLDKQYRVQWSAISGTRQAKKTRGGNFEDLWVFTKG